MSLQACFLVLLGGFLGGTSRFFVSGAVGRRVGETFPWGTFAVNVSGSALIGVLASLGQRHGGFFAGDAFRAFFVVGFCGGYTTVSSFSLQTLNLALDGERRGAAFNVVASALACLAATGAGFLTVAGLAR